MSIKTKKPQNLHGILRCGAPWTNSRQGENAGKSSYEETTKQKKQRYSQSFSDIIIAR